MKAEGAGDFTGAGVALDQGGVDVKSLNLSTATGTELSEREFIIVAG